MFIFTLQSLSANIFYIVTMRGGKKMNNIKDRIKDIRIGLNLSQTQFGDKIGISNSQIACYESGLRNVPERSINDICREFNINKDWLITGEGEKFAIPEDINILTEALTKISMSENKTLQEVVVKLTKMDGKFLRSLNAMMDVLLEK